MKFFHGKKGHFATEKRAPAKTWGAWPPLAPRFLRPWLYRQYCKQKQYIISSNNSIKRVDKLQQNPNAV
jgi:hypothetical protein